MHNCMDYICITWATYAQLYGLHMHNYMDYICISIWTTYASFIFKTVMSGTHTHAGWRTVYERREVIPKMAALQSIVMGCLPFLMSARSQEYSHFHSMPVLLKMLSALQRTWWRPGDGGYMKIKLIVLIGRVDCQNACFLCCRRLVPHSTAGIACKKSCLDRVL